MTADDPGRGSMNEDLRAVWRRLQADQPPRDVVRPRQLTRADVERADRAAAGTVVTITTPGEITYDVDGMPAGMGQATTDSVTLGGIVITRADADRLGIEEGDFENVTIAD